MHIKCELYVVLEIEVEVDCQSFEEETSETSSMLQARNNSMIINSKLNGVTFTKIIEFVQVNKSKYRSKRSKRSQRSKRCNFPTDLKYLKMS